MVLQTYGLSISSDDECIENRLIDTSEAVISERKGVNYSDNMLAMSPFAGDYPPTTNYINYTDLDASYATQGKDSASGPRCMLISSLSIVWPSVNACTQMKLNTISMSPDVASFCKKFFFEWSASRGVNGNLLRGKIFPIKKAISGEDSRWFDYRGARAKEFLSFSAQEIQFSANFLFPNFDVLPGDWFPQSTFRQCL